MMGSNNHSYGKKDLFRTNPIAPVLAVGLRLC